VVERTFAWLNRNRRLAKDVEATIESSATWLYIASVKLMSSNSKFEVWAVSLLRFRPGGLRVDGH
jgi:hypothetical protein